ncbi:NAD-dependent epimerase/dehydratase family protein [Brevibacterium sediminis]|uniref:NAD-dependent epimerase/dehydratase family protein n=1 Tax=Brevibacterium sediminis TaxID=1857024 RepID=UPI0021753CEA|nr:NAD-dependent epimerase/dehydratase family protein [Brevibacterium sediminis]MCS4593213.1 NAD-dependent epimerase/dehydratase family protein [Brevibacterium sediminis]
MRVAVIGATGNVGTAILDVLGRNSEVTSVLGISRRMPDTEAEPYARCDWRSIDIAAASSADTAHRDLTEALTGADAVIHLAWLIQPNSDRDLLRRVNVDGTARVAAAAAAAGVPHLVVASSEGAYSPDDSLDKRDEGWPTEGIRSSHYSVDKAAQERVLDDFCADHPEITVTRLRPALIFGAPAASEIQRYFLANWMPVQLLRAGRLPFLPLTTGLRGVQAVHSTDVARAYVASVLHRCAGAFNICADDVLYPKDLAELLDHGRHVPLLNGAVRAALAVGHSSSLVAADEGWLDMGLNVPLMDNGRARRELGWEPEYSAMDSARELLKGMADGEGAASVPLRPRDPGQPQLRATDGTSTGHEASDAGGAHSEVDMDLLGLYLSDHLTGATAGAERIERMAADFVDTPVFAALSELAAEIRGEHLYVQHLIGQLGLRRRPLAEALSWAGERVGRLKSNGSLLRRSPMTLVLEAELMRSAVIGKLGMWQTLKDNAEALGLDGAQFSELAQKAELQREVLDTVHSYARSRAFRRDLAVFDQSSGVSPVRGD